MNLEQYGIGLIKAVPSSQYWDFHKEGLWAPFAPKCVNLNVIIVHFLFSCDQQLKK